VNTWKRKILALASVPLLAVPSAIGVYTYLEPQSGYVGAGFEVLYIGVNILIINTPELQRYARNVSLGAVIVAVLMNSLAHYAASVPGAYSSAAFAIVPAILAVIASAPLAGLAYAVSVLLHRLSESDAPQIAPDPLDAYPTPTMQIGSTAYARPSVHEEMQFSPPARAEMQPPLMQPAHHACPKCGAALDAKQYAAAKRWKQSKACKDT
jgi:hypothetical protein